MSSILFQLMPSALWIIGLSLWLAPFSFNLTNDTRLGWSPTYWVKAASSRNTQPGWFLTSVGLGFATEWWPARIAWFLLALNTAYQWWSRRPDKQLSKEVTTNSEEEAGFNPTSVSNSKIRASKAFLFLEITRPFWSLALLPLFLLGQGHYLIFGIAGLSLLWLLTGFTTRNWGQKTPVVASFIIWLLLIPVTLLVTPSFDLTIQFLGYFLAQLILCYTVVSWTISKSRLIFIANSLVAIGGLLALISPLFLLQTTRFFPAFTKLDFLKNLFSETFHKNVVAGVLVVLLPVSIGLVIGQLAKGKFFTVRVLFNLFISLTLIAGLIFTQSRGGYLAGAVATLLTIGLNLRRRFQILLIIFLFIILVISIVLFADRWTDLLSDYTALGGIEGRLELWSRAIYAIQDFPFTGIGLGTFSIVIPVLYPYFLQGPDPVPHAHNLFLQVGVDLGIPGLIAFLAFIFTLATVGYLGWQTWKITGNNEQKWLISGCLGGLCAVLVQGTVDAVTWGTRPACLTWAVFGLLLSSFITSKFENKKVTSSEKSLNKELLV